MGPAISILIRRIVRITMHLPARHASWIWLHSWRALSGMAIDTANGKVNWTLPRVKLFPSCAVPASVKSTNSTDSRVESEYYKSY